MYNFFSQWLNLKNFVLKSDAYSYTQIDILLSCLIFLFIFVCILLVLSFLLSPKVRDIEKNSPYECGFNPFEDTRSIFEIHFYRVAILFIIFDLEIAFLLPWVMVYDVLGFFGFWVVTIFLFLLTLGFVYELMSGALDWD